MKQWLKISAPMAAIALIGISAQAAQIVGTVSMGGNVTLNATSLGAATAATAFTSVSETGSPGSSYGTTFGPATFNPFSWNPASTPVNPLWTFTTAGGETFSFNLMTITSFGVQNLMGGSQQLTITGTGVVSGSGPITYDNTAANWVFNITDSAGGTGTSFQFGFNDSNTSQLPDSGMTLTLLGGVLSGLALIKRKLA